MYLYKIQTFTSNDFDLELVSLHNKHHSKLRLTNNQHCRFTNRKFYAIVGVQEKIRSFALEVRERSETQAHFGRAKKLSLLTKCYKKDIKESSWCQRLVSRIFSSEVDQRKFCYNWCALWPEYFSLSTIFLSLKLRIIMKILYMSKMHTLSVFE